MSLELSRQTTAFLGSLILGAGLGAVFDVFRVLRRAFCQPVWLVWLEDVLYLMICAVITYGYMLQSSEGRVRIFILVGELLGAVLYYMTLGRLVMTVSLAIISAIRWILNLIYLVFIRPVLVSVRFVANLIGKINGKFTKSLKKVCLKLQSHLKADSIVLYNYLKQTGGRFKKRKKGKTHGKE